MKKLLNILNFILIGITGYFVFTNRNEKTILLFVFQILIYLLFNIFYISSKKLYKPKERNLYHIVGSVMAQTQVLSNASFLYFILYSLAIVSFPYLFVLVSFLLYITAVVCTIYLSK